MRRNSLRRSAIGPLTQKINAPQHLLRLKDEEDDDERDDERDDDRFRLPSLPRQRSWKNDDDDNDDDDDIPFNSAATSVSWSQEVANGTTHKLEEQWATVERTFYEEDDQLSLGPVLDECAQWRTQIPYLRIVGRNPVACNVDDARLDVRALSAKKTRELDDSQNDKVFAERSLLMKEGEDSVQYKLNKAKFQDVLDMMMEYIISELFPDEKSDTDSLCDDLSDALRITPAPVHSNRNSLSRNSKTNWTEEAISPNYIENKSISIRNRLLDTESSLQTIKNDTSHHQGAQKRSRNSISANKLRDFDDAEHDDALKSNDCTPHIGRNKLGTIFNERIIVSPVPFRMSTRESFSTLRTVPIKFMNENLEISCQRSARNIGFQGSARQSGALRNLNIRSAWQPPVSSTVWPKNVRLAPLDTSRLPSSKNRLLAPSPTALHCSRRPLSPISRSTIPKSAHVNQYCGSDFLTVQGKHIGPVHSRLNLLSADCNPRMAKSKKKKNTRGAKERTLRESLMRAKSEAL
ncbi:uncharacterized protein LOC105839526 [Monomorium pharaonis]|uniref:uncharacterized protein LOC105839526 n=1 Tax=Monomorium pharaonis TaxID=307658 RepID=UPI00063FB101|nr:uncharacterized protein LOC105839526 [Monomorium pharaonis]